MNFKFEWRRTYAFITLGIALSFPVQIFILYSHPLSEWKQALDKLTVLNAFTMLLLAALAVTAWIGHRIFPYMAGATVILLTLNNSAVAKFGDDFPPGVVYTGSLIFTIWAFSPYLVRLFRPARIARRVRFAQPIAIVTNDRTLNHVLAYDISRSGIFLHSMEENYYGLQPGDTVGLYWKNTKQKLIESRAVVVRTADPKGNYPRGLALRFEKEIPTEAYH